jgi:SAM-dependent methyltransferase
MNERTIYSACPLCENPEIANLCVGDCSKHPLYKPTLSPQIHWKQCRNCKHVFTSGYFTEAACRLLFSGTNASQAVGYELEAQRLISARMIEKVLPFASMGAWLDVGFGNGSLLFTAQEFGFIPVGIDLRSENVRIMSSLGIASQCIELGQLRLAEPCAVISMADVLEHMPYPKEGLRQAYGLLQERGVLFVSMPNSESVLWTAMNQSNANPYWGEIEHYHNFGRTRLYALLEEAGFEPVRYGISERYRACMEVIARKR